MSASLRLTRCIPAALVLSAASALAPHASGQEAHRVTGERARAQPRAKPVLRLGFGTLREPFEPKRRFAERPECGTMMYFGEGMAAGMAVIGEAIARGLDLVVPDVGALYTRQHSLAPVLAWPVVIPFGPVRARHVTYYHCSEDVVDEFRPLRFVPELGVSLASETSVWLRLGYGAVLHSPRSKFGLIAGIGPAFALRDARVATLLSPELGVHFGACCKPLFLTLLARYEHVLFGDAPPSVLFKFGFSYW